MSEWYFASLLVMTGVCFAFALHAANLALATRARQYVDLLLLALLEAIYCTITYLYFRQTDGARALPYGQAICIFTPFITYVFGELVVTLAPCVPRWLRTGQKINLVLTVAFVGCVLSDFSFGTQLALSRTIDTDLGSVHRHLLTFQPIGLVYLAWVSVAFSCFAWMLFAATRVRREFLPMSIGCVIYFVATVLDFGILVRVRDAHFIQHGGFFALVFGCWLVLARRFEILLAEQRAAVDRLERERQKLLTAAPMLHMQKLESLGTLAAGVAHEINNPIHGILNYASLMRKTPLPEEQVASFLEEIQREAQRVASIVRNLLRFGRAEESEAIASNARDVVCEMLTLVRSILQKDSIELDVSIDEPAPELVCRVQQLQQVLMNLMMNARDALHRRDPERAEPMRIEIRVGSVTRCDPSGAPEGWVFFEVIDNGDGFEEAIAQRIFDPFFTTKTGDGLGLGLSISHGIVLAHGGTLTCDSHPSERTKFRVEIPCARPPERTSAVQRAARNSVRT